ncbi:thiamine-phosphate pyrophosphorylase [Pedobacter steynii]|uniref:Thiamine-phosphate pyrophosphorylase n=1 Tax=Pedobacter steynii TaxID=430522 RepID=A0A1H0B9L8_9SPHI|nr:thiamine phosphate synthase [Pedobacter steynii]NQX41117.1 thiamine phosphate synthase [Pedobacter steynii]SDN42329.1 thiamine-phosphate pyrophosphorylase [Pedobacter steynii]
MELIVISKPSFFEGEANLINELFESGMERFHLRKEGAEKHEYEQLLGNIHPQYLERVALHQFHELAADFGIGRLHFPEAQRKSGQHLLLPPSEATILSTSIHKTDQLADLENFKYTFYGPVFQSISKKDYPSVVPNGFKLRNSTRVKVIALGGITTEKIDLVRQMGFDGAAILGSLWNQPELAVNHFKKSLEKCQTTDPM